MDEEYNNNNSNNYFIRVSISMPPAASGSHHNEENHVANSNPGLQLLLKVERLQALQHMQQKSTGHAIA
jgi:hypothetical protein